MSAPTETTIKSYSPITPYKAAQVLTQALRAAGKIGPNDKIEPQPMYGKARIPEGGGNSVIASFRVNTGRLNKDGTPKLKIYFDGAAFAQYLRDEVEGRTVTVKRSVDALVAEYMGDGNVMEIDGDLSEDDYDARENATVATAHTDEYVGDLPMSAIGGTETEATDDESDDEFDELAELGDDEDGAVAEDAATESFAN